VRFDLHDHPDTMTAQADPVNIRGAIGLAVVADSQLAVTERPGHAEPAPKITDALLTPDGWADSANG